MEDQGKPSRVVVTDAWRKEQQAKRDAYEAKRRAWARSFERDGEAEEGVVLRKGTQNDTPTVEIALMSAIFPESRPTIFTLRFGARLWGSHLAVS
jgi:hypothetical protein